MNDTILSQSMNSRQIRRLEQTLLDIADQYLEDPFVAIASEIVYEFGVWSLRLYVDRRDQRIAIDECALVSRQLVPHLEQLPEIATLAYQIEIGSPGLFRTIVTPREVSFYRGALVALALVASTGEVLPATAQLPVRLGRLWGQTETHWQIVPIEAEGDHPFRVAELTGEPILLERSASLKVTLSPPVDWPEDDEDEPDPETENMPGAY